ncbi:MAG: hypothetical protein Q4B86_08135 [Eubacteriales bacterium]|nr:hypothetical protein [Eubacteriales bacterium]
MVKKAQSNIPQLLKQNLISLLNTLPIHKIHITQLCKISHINRATFYAYYSDIYELLHDIEKDIIAEICELMNNTDYSISKSAYITECFFTYIYEHRSIVRVLLSNGNQTDFASDINEVLTNLLRKSVYIQYDIPEDLPLNKLNDILSFIVFGHYAFYVQFFISADELNKDMILDAAKTCSELSEICLKNYLKLKSDK